MNSEPTLFGPARSGSLVGALGLGSVLGLAILTGCSVSRTAGAEQREPSRFPRRTPAERPRKLDGFGFRQR